jgi:uncharacterized membrane protein YvlD (DUF360 family)
MRDDARPTLRHAIRPAIVLATIVAALALARVLVAVARGSAPVLYLFVVPVLTFGFFFATALVLQVSGALTRDPANHFQFNVNRWFAWLVCGGLVFFFVGLLARGHNVLATDAPRVGLLSALAWGGFVVLTWLCVTLFSQRGA